MISKLQIDAYFEQGFAVVPNLLTASELAELNTAVAAVEEKVSNLQERGIRFQLAPAPYQGHTVANAVADPIEDHPGFLRILSLPKVLNAIEPLLGTPNIKLHHTKLFMKYPDSTWSIHWHQDFLYLLHSNFDLLAVMFMLDDSNEDNGCLRVIPGSHKRGPLEPTIKEGWMLDLATHAEERAAVSVEVPAGGASIHHCCLLHSSLPNRSSRPRRAFIVQYAAGDNFPIAGRTDYAGYGTFLRGSNPWRVRSVGGHWHMSPPRRRDRQHQ